jgi:hypothetical protein
LTEAKNPQDAHALVKRWTRHVDLFAMDFVIVPINLHCHWSICVLVRPGLVLNPPPPDVLRDPHDSQANMDQEAAEEDDEDTNKATPNNWRNKKKPPRSSPPEAQIQASEPVDEEMSTRKRTHPTRRTVLDDDDEENGRDQVDSEVQIISSTTQFAKDNDNVDEIVNTQPSESDDSDFLPEKTKPTTPHRTPARGQSKRTLELTPKSPSTRHQSHSKAGSSPTNLPEETTKPKPASDESKVGADYEQEYNRPCVLCMDSIKRLHPAIGIAKNMLE